MAIGSKTSLVSPHDHTVNDILKGINGDGGVDLEEPLIAIGDDDDDGTRKPILSPSGTSFIRTCFNGLNAMSGVGILSIPYAVAEGGWLSLALLIMVAIISFYTGLLIKRCMDVDMRIKSYPDIGELAFGHKGRLLVSTFMCLELYLAAVGLLILEGDNLDKQFPNFRLQVGLWRIAGKECFVLLVAIVILPTTCLKNLGLLAYISVGGVLASLVVVMSVFSAATMDGVGLHKKGKIMNLSGLPTALGLYTFCFCGHGVFPTIYTSMKDGRKFSKVLLFCFTLCTINYGAMGIIGYLMYGEDIQSQVTLNLPSGKLSSKVAICTTVINPLTKYALMVTPVAVAIEEQLKLHYKISGSIFVRTFMVLSTVLIALLIPFYGYFTALLGSFLGISVSIFLPCMCYLRIFKPSQVNKIELAIIVASFLFGFLIASMGTYSSLQQIVHEFRG